MHVEEKRRYSHKNAAGATVHDLDNQGKQIPHVVWVDTRTGTVCISPQPVRLTHTGRIETRRIRFASVWPIWAGSDKPMMFHCAGRLSRSEHKPQA